MQINYPIIYIYLPGKMHVILHFIVIQFIMLYEPD